MASDLPAASTSTSSTSNATKPKSTVTPATTTSTSKKIQAKALWQYTKQSNEELDLAPGQIVNIQKKDPSGWWIAEFNGKTGYVPGNFLQEISEEHSSPVASSQLHREVNSTSSQKAASSSSTPTSSSAKTVPSSTKSDSPKGGITTTSSSSEVDTLTSWLQSLRLEHIKPQMIEVGVQHVDDLQYLSTEDINGFNLKPIEKKKLVTEIGKLAGLSGNNSNDNNIPASLPSSPIFEMVKIDPNSDEFGRVAESIDYQQHHEHYVIKRIEQKQYPITFKLIGLTKVVNSTLEFAFKSMLHQLQVDFDEISLISRRPDEPLKNSKSEKATTGLSRTILKRFAKMAF